MDGCFELNKVRAIYKPRKPPVEGEAKPPRKWAGPAAGLPPFRFASVSSFTCRLLHLLEFMSFTIAPLWTSLSRRYLRGKDGIGNPSLNLHLLCLIPKHLHGWASNQHGLWSFLWALAFVFLRVGARSRASSFHTLK